MRILIGLAMAASLVFGAVAQDSPYRQELKRADLKGTNMEVVTSISEVQPGQTSMLHIHHGEEAYYYLEGGTVETPDGKQVVVAAGTNGINLRDAPHGAYKVVGDKLSKF